jgi:hypothetical protein
MGRVYWGIVGILCFLIIAIPVNMLLRNPDVGLVYMHGPSSDAIRLMREWDRLSLQHKREQGRLSDFAAMFDLLNSNYPFFDLVNRQIDGEPVELAVSAFEELQEVAGLETDPAFFVDFINDRFLGRLGGYGNPRVATEPRLAEWILEPYFYGHHDWRFTDERFEIEVRGGNTDTHLLEDVAYLRIHHFLPMGYEPISRHPYWRFDFETEKRALSDFFGSLDGIGHLVIDIRGIGSGFGDYFLPLVLTPLADRPVNARFYGFNTEGWFARRVSNAFQDWYGLEPLSGEPPFDLPEWLTNGFAMDIAIQPIGDDPFGGRKWLLTDTDNFSGPNFMYLQMARDAGFTIIYEESPLATGWDTSLIWLTHTGTTLRFNPLYFTDDAGKPLEAYGPVPDYVLEPGGEWLAIIRNG